jgi:hypothetical protein
MKTIFIRTLTFMLFASFLSVNASAQLGIRGGLSFTNVSIDTDDNFDADGVTGFHFGVFADIGLGDALALRPGLVYNTKGFEIENVETSLNYFDVPLNIALRFGSGPGKFVIEGGPYFGLFLDGDADGDELEGGEDIETTELGMNGGIAWETDHFGIGINYKKALSDVLPDGLTSYSAQNNVWSLFVMLKL